MTDSEAQAVPQDGEDLAYYVVPTKRPWWWFFGGHTQQPCHYYRKTDWRRVHPKKLGPRRRLDAEPSNVCVHLLQPIPQYVLQNKPACPVDPNVYMRSAMASTLHVAADGLKPVTEAYTPDDDNLLLGVGVQVAFTTKRGVILLFERRTLRGGPVKSLHASADPEIGNGAEGS